MLKIFTAREVDEEVDRSIEDQAEMVDTCQAEYHGVGLEAFRTSEIENMKSQTGIGSSQVYEIRFSVTMKS